MSRIGKKPIEITKGVTITRNGNVVKVKGPKGELETQFHSKMSIDVKDNEIVVTRPDDSKENKALHGLTRALFRIWLSGVVNPYTKTLDIVGVGYKAELKGKKSFIEYWLFASDLFYAAGWSNTSNSCTNSNCYYRY